MDANLQSIDLKLSAYNYNLPADRIAQTPAVPRDSSRLLVVQTQTQQAHQVFRDLPNWLRPGDLLVMNNTKVIPARLQGIKIGGAKVEVLLLEETTRNQWLALVKPGRRLQPGAMIEFIPIDAEHPTNELRATVLSRDDATGGRLLEFTVTDDRSLIEVVDRFGTLPLPPYITGQDSTPDQYQTVYADRDGSAAAPTAGLHFTPELLEQT